MVNSKLAVILVITAIGSTGCSARFELPAGPAASQARFASDVADQSTSLHSFAGQFTTYPVPVGGNAILGPIASGPDGNLWFVAPIGLDYLTPQGTITEVPTPEGPLDISRGVAGALWFSTVGKIAKIKVDESIKYYNLYGQGFVTWVIPGPGGNEWFSLAEGHVGKITPDGVITEFATFRPDWQIGQLAAGPDGNVWFSFVTTVGRIEKVTPNGVFTTYLLPSGCTTGRSLVVASDGNLWTPAGCDGKAEMARITTAGSITFFHIATGLSNIVAGPHDDIWGFEAPHDLLSFNIVTHHESQPIPYPIRSDSSNQLGGMTFDHNGNLWLTSSYGDDPNAAEIVEYHL